MADGSRGRGRGLTYRRQVILVLILVAVVPLALFGFAVIKSVEEVVGDEALTQARTAVGGVAAVLARDAADLDETTQSYATWQILQDEVAGLDLEAIRRDVIQFQVDRGEVDAIVLIVGDRQVAGGPAAATAALSTQARGALVRPVIPTGAVYSDLGTGSTRSTSNRSTSLVGPDPGSTPVWASRSAWRSPDGSIRRSWWTPGR